MGIRAGKRKSDASARRLSLNMQPLYTGALDRMPINFHLLLFRGETPVYRHAHSGSIVLGSAEKIKKKHFERRDNALAIFFHSKPASA